MKTHTLFHTLATLSLILAGCNKEATTSEADEPASVGGFRDGPVTTWDTCVSSLPDEDDVELLVRTVYTPAQGLNPATTVVDVWRTELQSQGPQAVWTLTGVPFNEETAQFEIPYTDEYWWIPFAETETAMILNGGSSGGVTCRCAPQGNGNCVWETVDNGRGGTCTICVSDDADPCDPVDAGCCSSTYCEVSYPNGPAVVVKADDVILHY